MRDEEKMKTLVLIRHAKSSWADPDLSDFSRPLNRRGKRDAPEMGKRLAARGLMPELMVASPAKRAKKTAIHIARQTGYQSAAILYDERLYLSSPSTYIEVIKGHFEEVDLLFLIGHNHALTDLAEYLGGTSLGNVPTAGTVAIAYRKKRDFLENPGGGKIIFFDFPKNKG